MSIENSAWKKMVEHVAANSDVYGKYASRKAHKLASSFKDDKDSEEVQKFWEQQRISKLDHQLEAVSKETKLQMAIADLKYIANKSEEATIHSELIGERRHQILESGLRPKNYRDEIDSFFQSPPEGRSNEEGKVEKHIHKGDELSCCSNCGMEINISGSVRMCPYCRGDIVNGSVSEELDYEMDEESDTDNEDEEDNSPPKVDKVAFREAHGAIPHYSKLRLSTGKIVEDVLFEFAKDLDYEHHAHSYIVNCDDQNIKALFTNAEWEELTKDRIRIPPVPNEIVKEMARYGKKTLEELRTIVMTTYLKDEEKYDIRKHYDKEWIQVAMRALCNLYENTDSPMIRNQYEDWYTVAIFGSCIDFCVRDTQLGTDIKRTDAPSVSSANRKNRGRQANTRTRKLTGRKIDGIIYSINRKLEMGVIEAAKSFLGVSDRKYLLEAFKMPKTLRDMYTDMMIAVNYEREKADRLQVVGILHLGLWIQFVRLWRAGGSVCIFRKDPRSFNVDGKFSKEGVRSFLKLLIAIYQYKLIIKDNLQVLNVLGKNNNDNGSDDDLENELMEASRSSTPPPTSRIGFFADNTKTPRKLRKKKPVKKRRLNKD
ncbi:8653_t:CDS:2 [Paraglomus occultum]|uniref:8653_t:CDS:1 n=1 Tax=Paraglomus occultum TaxID=144539 RepID=A0A9N8WB46_9GLOM|nr:8653_t:CDS:2 [Paraglomus occultum]